MRRVGVALVHHPVLDAQGAVVTTAVTNLDVHDLARSARTYGCSDYFVTHPIAAQRELVERIRAHWLEGSGGRRIPDRREALGVLRVVSSLGEAIDALVRQIPGALGNETGSAVESFRLVDRASGKKLLEYPQYTRPAEFRGSAVPEVLAGGNHAEIARWRKERAIERTKARRPELHERYEKTRGEP